MVRKVYLTLMMVVMMCFCIGGYKQKDVEASSKYELNRASDVIVKKNGISFQATQNNTSDYDDITYRLTMKKKGKTTVITNNSNCSFLTNGKILYYVNKDKKVSDYEYKNTIYKYNITTGKQSKVISGKEYTVAGCNGKYLYCGRDDGPDGIKLYAFNLKNKKKKYMQSVVGEVLVSGQYVATGICAGDADNFPIHIFRANGSGKKKIASGIPLKITKKKLYYAQVNLKTWKQRVYTCSLKGKNKKAVTGWMTQIPKKYYK